MIESHHPFSSQAYAHHHRATPVTKTQQFSFNQSMLSMTQEEKGGKKSEWGKERMGGCPYTVRSLRGLAAGGCLDHTSVVQYLTDL